MAGPQKQFDTDIALDKALTVFWQQGFEMTSVQDLVSGMGINRASLYDTFGNKNELYQKALRRYIEKSLAETRQFLLEGTGSVAERLMNFFVHLSKTHQQEESNFGCFLNNTAVELGPHYPEIAEVVRDAWTEMETVFQELLKEGVEKGELSPDTNIATLAATINMTLQGISVMAKAGTPNEHLGQIVGAVLGMLKPQA